MTRTIAALLILALPQSTRAADLSAQSKPQPRLGMNLNGPADWNSELPFVDVFRLSRPWISQRQVKAGAKARAGLDVHGWVKSLASRLLGRDAFMHDRGRSLPQRSIHAAFRWRRHARRLGRATVVSREPGRLTIRVDASRGSFFLKLLEPSPELRPQYPRYHARL